MKKIYVILLTIFAFTGLNSQAQTTGTAAISGSTLSLYGTAMPCGSADVVRLDVALIDYYTGLPTYEVSNYAPPVGDVKMVFIPPISVVITLPTTPTPPTSVSNHSILVVRVTCANGTAATWVYIDGQLNSFVLPIKLTSFGYTKQNNQLALNWTTEIESGSDYFEIQYSSDGKEYQTVSKVKAAGNSYSVKNYAFTTLPPTNKGYYRLKMVDLDGRFDYSNVLKYDLSNNTDTKLSINPNPVYRGTNAGLSITNIEKGIYNVRMSDMTGKVVSEISIQVTGDNLVRNFNIPSTIKPGMYIITVKNANNTVNLINKIAVL